ncbi:114_t:CDS:10 [Diversispora eburnea]|uniref:114_t:CDS:1 n=1 Tax=Diversispora eburnea TaxID=1213867 RepID=A0A9N8Z107_9GLOM|nr:114_t:CDS:10 [Diversispora eburnea]
MQMEYEILEKNEDFEDDTCVKSSSHFEQSSEFFSHLPILLNAIDDNTDNEEKDVEQERVLRKLISLIDPYQEQPYLLDPHLENMVKPIVDLFRIYIRSFNAQDLFLSRNSKDNLTKDNKIQVSNKIKRLFILMYYLMKIRGYKTIVKFFSHEVSDLEPTYYFLVALDPKDYTGWETRYVLLIWLSLICMIPFDLKTVDSLANDTEGKKAKRDGAAVLLSRLLTRRDIAEVYLADYIQWAQDEVKNNKDVFTITGILTSLCAIYKLGQRQTSLPTLDIAWPCLSLLDDNQIFANNTLVRKMLVKLAQRFGLCYLKPKVAAWRYKRGNRSLKDNLGYNSKTTSIDPLNINQSLKEVVEDEDEIPDQIEEIIEILLNGLRNKDTVVRWSAAKGLGRIAQRLPQELADDIIGSLFELFSENTYKRNGVLELSAVSDHTWHGVCLAVAELARRGLLLPERLSEVVPWVSKALKFDLKRGTHSIGAHVRDAACYVCWSFARAYEPKVLAPHVAELANSLVVVSVFDREVNVRRASSAAFQENVGRLGVFPHGIDIITTADYFTVGNKVNAFLEISVKIAKFEEYKHHMIDHLRTITISNWDKRMRELGAKALHNLTRLDLDYMINIVLPYLIPLAKSPDMDTRHGALLATGEICLSWSLIKGNDKSWIEEHEPLITRISNIIDSLPDTLFTSFGSEVTVQAAVNHIACLAKANWPVNSEILNNWKWVVKDLLTRKDETGQQMAVDALEAIIVHYGIEEKEILKYPFILFHISSLFGFTKKFCEGFRGFVLALGVIRYDKIPECLELSVNSLILSSKLQETKMWNDPETRRNAFTSFTVISKNLGESFKTFCSKSIFDKMLEAAFVGLEDYNVDLRGDIGSWIRKASMMYLAVICPLMARLDQKDPNCEPWLSDELIKKIFGNLLKQSVERIDKIRTCAGNILMELLYARTDDGENWLFNIKGREVLQSTLPKDEEIHWISPLELYPRMVKLLVLPDYRLEALTGFVLAAGGLTESLIRHSSSTLLEYASELPNTSTPGTFTLSEFANTLLEIFRKYERVDRVVIPLLEVLDLLLENETLQKIDPNSFSFEDLFECVKKEVTKTREIRKLTCCARVFCGMTSLNENLRNRSLYQLLGLLVRRLTADQLYLTLTSMEDEESENLLQIEDILANTDWNNPVPQLKEIRNQLYPLLGLKLPVFKISTGS